MLARQWYVTCSDFLIQCEVAVRRAGLFRKGKTRSGATTLEFALIAPILLVLMFGLIEAGVIYIGQAWISNATNEMGRLVRTGQIQAAAIDQTQFRSMVCARIAGFFNCDANLQIDVQAYPTFAAATMGAPVDAGGNLDPSLTRYNPGTSCQVVLVRVFYKYAVQTPFFTTFLVNLAGNRHLITAATAYRNEPFTSDVSGC
jgi:Flp pilus assembly protein TadG